MKSFTHLHVHTEYSLLDGASKIKDLVVKAKNSGMGSIAITDHGNMFGSIEFYKACKEINIKPIIGVEAYLVDDIYSKDNFSKSEKESKYTHITLLAKNLEGYRNLVKLVTKSYLDGFYYKPRIDKKLLEAHKDGILVLSGCIAGEIPRLIKDGLEKEAISVADWYVQIFGKENFYIEIQEHGIEEEKIVNPGLFKLAKKLGLKMVFTVDSHYLEREDAEMHDILLCIQTGKKVSDVDRLKFEGENFYLLTPEEIYAKFESEFGEAIKNTMEVSEKCNLEISFNNKELMPQYSVDGKVCEDPDKVISEMVFSGLEKIFRGKVPEEYIERANYELEVIRKMGFSNYFLVVQDFVNWAKSRNIPVGPGRGSAAGALITYALGITNIDPIRYNLLFERFLNPERVTMPDIDVDVADRNRDEVIEYLTNKYGRENTANIITFGTLQTKAAIRDVGRVLGIPLSRVDTIAKSLDRVEYISEAKEVVEEVRNIVMGNNDEEKKWIEASEKLEGIVRHASIHASGIVISSVPIHEYIPLYKDPKEGKISTQIPATYLEELGFLKMDILGLSNLSVIYDTLELIKKRKNVEIDINSIPLDDEKTYKLLSSGETDGVFQVESDGMKRMLMDMKPSCIEDIIAALALYRPGPLGSGMDKQYINRKHNREPIEYPHPDLEEILKETYGVILYQEQIMKIAQKIAGFTLGQADNLRRAIGKKKPEIMEQMKKLFIEGSVKKGYSESFAKELYEMIEKFADYGFNKSHSAAYAIITYQTAYLKANYPVEYMTSLINSEIGKFDKMVKYIEVARNMGIEILQPDVNNSQDQFSIELRNNKDAIRYGLLGIKGLGESVAKVITQERETNGKYKTIEDFFERTVESLKKNSYEVLAMSGALDRLIDDRGKIISNMEKIISNFEKNSRHKSVGQNELFGESSSVSVITRLNTLESNLSMETLAAYEKQTIGVYLKFNPLKEYGSKLDNISRIKKNVLEILPEGCPFSIFGLVKDIVKKDAIKGKIAYVEVETMFKETVPMFFAPEIFKSFEDLLKVDKILFFKGVIQKKVFNGENLYKVNKVFEISEVLSKEKFTEVHIIFDNTVSREDLEHLRDYTKTVSGGCIVMLGFHEGEKISYFRASSSFAVKPSAKFSSFLKDIKSIISFWYY